ncbi:MAG: GAF domain-containing protein [Myxococcales bacterium]|nr:GAF domain-containing protein [Myxococcales bacterium]
MGGTDRNRVAFETARLALARLRIGADAADHEVALLGALQLCAHTVKVERVGFWRFAHDRTVLELALGYARSSSDRSSGEVLLGSRHPTYWAAINERRLIAAHDAQHDPATAELAARYLIPLGITSLLDAPVFRAGELVGVVCFEHVGPARTWTADELAFATTTADVVAMALEQADRLLAEAALRVQTGRLAAAEKLDVIERLCRGLAHDFANVLLAVELVGGRLAQRGDAELAESLRGCAQVGGNLVGQLRRFAARGEDAPPRLAVRAVLERMVPIVVTLVRDTAAVEVEVEGLPPDAEAALAPTHLEQIILNLCLNARDAITAPGTIRLRARADDTAVVLEVSDDGAGIPPELLERIFEPYFTTKASGTGLGLATVKAIVDEADAAIEVGSVVGRGTTFTLTLPRT